MREPGVLVQAPPEATVAQPPWLVTHSLRPVHVTPVSVKPVEKDRMRESGPIGLPNEVVDEGDAPHGRGERMRHA
ncbi:MAG: hypothetical protein Q8L14_25780 [Myxococcales bacterium]|nr:hypothetical protein [Myxococcales bacterium]